MNNVKEKYRQALNAMERKDYKEAEKIAKELIADNNIEVSSFLGNVYFHSGEYKKAVQQYEFYYKFVEKKTDVLIAIAICYHQMNLDWTAEVYLKNAIQNGSVGAAYIMYRIYINKQGVDTHRFLNVIHYLWVSKKITRKQRNTYKRLYKENWSKGGKTK